MTRRIRARRPSPALVVAILALVAALAGTAVAEVATTAKLNKKEKKQVKKIARKQIKKLAPGLSVSHADTADTADSADTATNANHANSADTANQANTATSAQTAANAQALSGNTVVGEGDLDGPGLVTNSSCTPVSEPVPGAQPGDHVVLTPPSGWPTYEINLTARVTADTVTYEICNQSGAMANFGTSPPLRFLVFR
jgi:hypothetical protein